MTNLFTHPLRDAQNLARPLTGSSCVDSHGYHTLAKVHIAKIGRMLSGGDEQVTGIGLAETIKEAEAVIEDGLQRFPGDSYLLAAESDLGDLLSDDARSMNALKIAFENNPYNPFIVVRLAKVLVRTGESHEARIVYKHALDAGAFDKKIHFNYAKLLIDSNDESGMDIEYHLRRSFTDGDGNTEAQLWYGRQLYINGKIDEAQACFQRLKDCRGNPIVKREVRGVIMENGERKTFAGRVEQSVGDYGFVIRDGMADRVFLHRKNTEQATWEYLERNTRISFAIGFNYWGATAVNIRLE